MQEIFEKIKERLREQEYLNSYEPVNIGWNKCLKKAIEIVNQAVKEYNDDWIPCSEKLPYDDENIKRYIVQLENGRIDVLGFVKDAYKYQPLDFYGYKGKHKPIFYDYDPEYGYVENDDVIAWKPLPEPYKPKGEK